MEQWRQIRKEAAEKEPPFIRRSTALWITTAVGLASAVVFAVVSASIVLAIDRPNRASLGEWISDFAKSPGFAGLCAIAAAVLAFWGIHRQVAVSRKGLAHQREVEMKRAWWERFEWAASRAVPASKDGIPLPYDVILNTLTSLLDTATTKFSGSRFVLWRRRLLSVRETLVNVKGFRVVIHHLKF